MSGRITDVVPGKCPCCGASGKRRVCEREGWEHGGPYCRRCRSPCSKGGQCPGPGPDHQVTVEFAWNREEGQMEQMEMSL